MKILTGLLQALKLPLKLLVSLVGSKPKSPKNELAKKQLTHVQNFAPTHYFWQIRAGKKLTKKQKKYLKNRKQKNSKSTAK
jgi:hypothetical protein